MILPAWRRFKGAVAKPLRRGKRTVYSTPQSGRGFGNFLYYWLHADIQQSRGRDYRVLWTPGMEAWLAELPIVRDRLSITLEAMSFFDRRVASEDTWVDRFGVDFTREELGSFIRRFLIGSPLLGDPRPDTSTVTVNVRRGDYYSVPAIRGAYGFDLPAYLGVALPLALAEGGPAETIRVVSDDIDWCRTRLDGIFAQHAPRVDYRPPTDPPQENFRVVANAQRLIGTNSSFTYWAGYVSNVRYPDASQVVMPDFHARHLNQGHAYQLDPTWLVVNDIPGGWDS